MHDPVLLVPDIGFYVFYVGVVYTVVFLIGCITAALFRPRSRREYLMRIGKLGLFLAILLIVGDLVGCVWGEFIWGRFYLSTDYCNSDFVPYLPITSGIIDAPFGRDPHGLLGVTLTQLNLIWLVFSIATWGSTLLLYRLAGRLVFRKQVALEISDAPLDIYSENSARSLS